MFLGISSMASAYRALYACTSYKLALHAVASPCFMGGADNRNASLKTAQKSNNEAFSVQNYKKILIRANILTEFY